MKYIKIVSAWFIMLSFSAQLHGAAYSEKPISLQIENLTRWKNSSEASAIQKSLGAILKPHRNDPQSTELKFKRHIPIFKKPFLLLDAEPSGFGGFFGLVVFKDHPKLLRLWIYEIGKNVFEVREVEPQVTLNKEIMNELEDKGISPFWLTPL